MNSDEDSKVARFQVQGVPHADEYLAVQWSPQLGSQNWSAAADATFTEGRPVNGTAFPGGGMALAGFEDDGGSSIYVWRRVSSGGSFQSPRTVPLDAFVPKVGTDHNGDSYALGYSLDNFFAAIVKIKPDGSFAWNPPVFEEEDIYSFDAVHLSSDSKIYVSGYLNEAIGDDEFYVARYRPFVRLTISLNPKFVPPSKTTPTGPSASNKSIVTVTATDSANQPIPNLAIRLSTGIVLFSGGHDHDNGRRPAGILTRSSGTTSQNGIFITTYTPSEFGGYEKITASWADDIQVSTSAQLEVRVPKLALLLDSTTYKKIGGTCEHHGPSDDIPISCQTPDRNHWGAEDVIKAAKLIAEDYLVAFSTRPAIKFNDFSLPFGGLFDVEGNWKLPHKTHRIGSESDIRSNPPHDDGVPIDPTNFQAFSAIVHFRAPGSIIEIHGGPNNVHIHIYYY